MDAKIFLVSMKENEMWVPEKTKSSLISTLENTSGDAAAMCYCKGNFFDKINNEDSVEKKRRFKNCAEPGHQTVSEHVWITVELTGISKLLAMILNNQQIYNTSEKSGRYTNMMAAAGSQEEKDEYIKWYNIMKTKIMEMGIKEKWNPEKLDSFTTQLAQENARYMIDIHSPIVNMLYTLSMSRWALLVQWMDEYSKKVLSEWNRRKETLDGSVSGSIAKYRQNLAFEMSQFTSAIKMLGIYDDKLVDLKDRHIDDFTDMNKVFNDTITPENFNPDKVYVDCHDGVIISRFSASFASIAQLQRHRTLKYDFSILSSDQDDKNLRPFAPPILAGTTLESEYRNDMLKLLDLACSPKSMYAGYPAGCKIACKMVGSYENFRLMLLERLCGHAMYETNYVARSMFQAALENKEFLEFAKDYKMTDPNFTKCRAIKCSNPCPFIKKDGSGISTRII